MAKSGTVTLIVNFETEDDDMDFGVLKPITAENIRYEVEETLSDILWRNSGSNGSVGVDLHSAFIKTVTEVIEEVSNDG